MIIVWDEPKRLANVEKHGLDFADLQLSFSWGRILALSAHPSRTGRSRLKLICMLGDAGIVVAIVSPLGSEAISVLSLRRVGPTERRFYEQT